MNKQTNPSIKYTQPFATNSRFFSINKFIMLLYIALLSTMVANVSENALFRIFTYFSEILLLLYTYYYSVIKVHLQFFNKYILLVGVILMCNYIISPNNPNYSDLLKLFGYLCCFRFGNALAKQRLQLNINKCLFFLFVITPILIVGFFDKTDKKTLFFANSNVFVYIGLAMSLLGSILYGKGLKGISLVWLLLFLYVITGTSLGVVVAICIAILILNFKPKYLFPLIVGSIFLITAIIYIDLPVFIRIRDVFSLWQTIEISDLKNVTDINMYELSQRAETQGERTDTTSSIWRFTQWAIIFSDYIKSIWNIPFGLGSGYAIEKTGLPPHNDFLLILSEYGIFVFIFFFRFINKTYRSLKKMFPIYFILSMFIYHLTENLIFNFPANAVLYFSIGYLYFKKRYLSDINNDNVFLYENTFSK